MDRIEESGALEEKWTKMKTQDKGGYIETETRGQLSGKGIQRRAGIKEKSQIEWIKWKIKIGKKKVESCDWETQAKNACKKC